MHRHTRNWLPVFAAAALLAAFSSRAQSVRAVPLTSVSPAHCVDTLAQRAATDPLRCPGALRTAVVEAQTLCRNAGGTLAGATEGDVWALDVNGDGRNELLFALDRNVSCEGAWSVFSCGSPGCPKMLYELRDGEWVAVGSIFVEAPEHVTLARAAMADGHRTIEACSSSDCIERWSYEWLGTMYEATRIEVRGTRVDVAGSIRGLYELSAATTLRAQPSSRAAEMKHYDAGTEVAILGTAAGGDYFYVSPCNACDSGFAPRAALQIP
jgi:hypothetical protein